MLLRHWGCFKGCLWLHPRAQVLGKMAPRWCSLLGFLWIVCSPPWAMMVNLLGPDLSMIQIAVCCTHVSVYHHCPSLVEFLFYFLLCHAPWSLLPWYGLSPSASLTLMLSSGSILKEVFSPLGSSLAPHLLVWYFWFWSLLYSIGPGGFPTTIWLLIVRLIDGWIAAHILIDKILWLSRPLVLGPRT